MYVLKYIKFKMNFVTYCLIPCLLMSNNFNLLFCICKLKIVFEQEIL